MSNLSPPSTYLLSLLLLVSTLSGCATIFSGDKPEFTIDSVPQGAIVKLPSGKFLGVTPITLRLPSKAVQNSLKTLHVQLARYHKVTLQIKPDFNQRTLLNFAFISSSLGFPSFTTDSVNRRLYRFDEGRYVIELKKKPQTSSTPSPPKRAEKEDLSRDKVLQRTKAQEALRVKQEALAKERARATAEKVELNRLQLEKERRVLEEERRVLEEERRELEKQRVEMKEAQEREQKAQEREQKAQEREQEKRRQIKQDALEAKAKAEANSRPGIPSEPKLKQEQDPEPQRSREEILLEKMKQRYQEQLKRRRQPSPPQDPRIPKGIEITPLSDWSDSPSYGALAMSIAHYRLIQEEIARGGGASLEDLYLRLCLAIDHQQPTPELVSSTYPLFVRRAQRHIQVLKAPHGLALFRALKPLHELSFPSNERELFIEP